MQVVICSNHDHAADSPNCENVCASAKQQVFQSYNDSRLYQLTLL